MCLAGIMHTPVPIIRYFSDQDLQSGKNQPHLLIIHLGRSSRLLYPYGILFICLDVLLMLQPLCGTLSDITASRFLGLAP